MVNVNTNHTILARIDVFKVAPFVGGPDPLIRFTNRSGTYNRRQIARSILLYDLIEREVEYVLGLITNSGGIHVIKEVKPGDYPEW